MIKNETSLHELKLQCCYRRLRCSPVTAILVHGNKVRDYWIHGRFVRHVAKIQVTRQLQYCTLEGELAFRSSHTFSHLCYDYLLFNMNNSDISLCESDVKNFKACAFWWQPRRQKAQAAPQKTKGGQYSYCCSHHIMLGKAKSFASTLVPLDTTKIGVNQKSQPRRGHSSASANGDIPREKSWIWQITPPRPAANYIG